MVLRGLKSISFDFKFILNVDIDLFNVNFKKIYYYFNGHIGALCANYALSYVMYVIFVSEMTIEIKTRTILFIYFGTKSGKKNRPK